MVYTYVTETGYYYAILIDQPERVVEFGEGDSPEEAAMDLQPTQYQSADFGCRAPSPSELPSYFLGMIAEPVVYGSDDDDEAASSAAGDA